MQECVVSLYLLNKKKDYANIPYCQSPLIRTLPLLEQPEAESSVLPKDPILYYEMVFT